MNPIADFLNELDRQRGKKVRRKPYCKPRSVKQLEIQEYEYKKRLHPDNPAVIKRSFRDDTANGLTNCVCKWLRINGHFAARTNTTGIYSKKLGRYIYSGSTKGQSDINAVFNGKSVQIEVKAGKDKPRSEQLEVAEKVRAAGGFYIFVKTFDDFLEQIEKVPKTVVYGNSNLFEENIQNDTKNHSRNYSQNQNPNLSTQTTFLKL